MAQLPNDQANAALYNAFMGLSIRPEVRGLWYNGKEIKLDGYRFISCRFDNCTLVVTSANFEIDRCYFDSSTRFLFGNEIAKPIRLFNKNHEWVFTSAPYFAPTRNSDGTISVTG